MKTLWMIWSIKYRAIISSIISSQGYCMWFLWIISQGSSCQQRTSSRLSLCATSSGWRLVELELLFINPCAKILPWLPKGFPYSQFLEAEGKDPKIEILSQEKKRISNLDCLRAISTCVDRNRWSFEVGTSIGHRGLLYPCRASDSPIHLCLCKAEPVSKQTNSK